MPEPEPEPDPELPEGARRTVGASSADSSAPAPPSSGDGPAGQLPVADGDASGFGCSGVRSCIGPSRCGKRIGSRAALSDGRNPLRPRCDGRRDQTGRRLSARRSPTVNSREADRRCQPPSANPPLPLSPLGSGGCFVTAASGRLLTTARHPRLLEFGPSSRSRRP